MSELRQLLDREAGRVHADVPAALETLVRRAERRHRSRRLAAGAVAVAVVAAGAFAGYRSLRPPVGVADPPAAEWRGIWPFAGAAEAEHAQAEADVGNPEFTWLRHPHQVVGRYIDEHLGWGAAHQQMFEREGRASQVLVSTCDPIDPAACESSVEEERQAVVTLEQLVRAGEGGIWEVVGAVQAPYSRIVRFGWGRVPTLGGGLTVDGRLVCPAGELRPPTATEAETAAWELLSRANGRDSDPRAVFEAAEPSLRPYELGPYELFAYHFEKTEPGPYASWRLGELHGPATQLAAWLLDTCPDAGRAAYVVQIVFPETVDIGVSASTAELVFIGTEDGPKLWAVT